MAGFLVLGGIGVVLLVVSIVLDDIFDGLFEGFEFGDGFLSGPTLAGFLTALGFGGALATSAGLAMLPAAGVGIAAGVVVGGIAGVVTRSVMRMPTDATPTTASLEGLDGVVVTPIPEGGTGEVTVRVGGQPVKLSARSDTPASVGASVRVIRALTPTSVVVEQNQ